RRTRLLRAVVRAAGSLGGVRGGGAVSTTARSREEDGGEREELAAAPVHARSGGFPEPLTALRSVAGSGGARFFPHGSAAGRRNGAPGEGAAGAGHLAGGAARRSGAYVASNSRSGQTHCRDRGTRLEAAAGTLTGRLRRFAGVRALRSLAH